MEALVADEDESDAAKERNRWCALAAAETEGAPRVVVAVLLLKQLPLKSLPLKLSLVVAVVVVADPRGVKGYR